MKVIGWAPNVNKKILDTTGITAGDSGIKEDQNAENNATESRATSFFNPLTFNVSMDFNWADKDANGKSEFDRFSEWFFFVHENGVNPFEFPSVTNFTTLGSQKTSLYKINGGFSASKSGYCMRVQMQWKEVYNGIIEIPKEEVQLLNVEANSERLIFHFSQLLQEDPSLSRKTTISYLVNMTGPYDLNDPATYESAPTVEMNPDNGNIIRYRSVNDIFKAWYEKLQPKAGEPKCDTYKFEIVNRNDISEIHTVMVRVR